LPVMAFLSFTCSLKRTCKIKSSTLQCSIGTNYLPSLWSLVFLVCILLHWNYESQFLAIYAKFINVSPIVMKGKKRWRAKLPERRHGEEDAHFELHASMHPVRVVGSP
jgi:hypothetical protein